MHWLATLAKLQARRIPAVMVSVASIVGSTPREPGAKMIVTADELFGTIGGGNLEFQACAIARDQLAGQGAQQLRRFPLGAGLGQCCGGLVNLFFEPVLETTEWIAPALKLQAAGQDWLRAVSTSEDDGAAYLLSSAAGPQAQNLPLAAQSALAATAAELLAGSEATTLHSFAETTSPWYFEANRRNDFELLLFGAGHVGRALVKVLSDLPIQIRWIDSRDEQFPAEVGPNVEIIFSDCPEAEVAAAAPGSYYLVMTHNHALDQCIAEQILKRDDFNYFGLIGSASKRRMFETRMHRRGMDPARFARMTCPIGQAQISSKQPAAIAIAVAAEILALYDQGNTQQKDKTVQQTLRGIS